MTAVHKKNEAQNDKKISQEPVVVSDVVTETTERVEIIEEVTPQAAKPKEAPSEPLPSNDPLSDFKEKMIKEELSASGSAPKKNFMWPILLIFVVTIAILIGVFVYRQGIFKGEKVNVASLSPTPTIAITPEPAKTIDLTQYEIEILNGSGVDGEAGRQRVNLEAEGFTVSSVGNADSSDYTDTIIQAKAEVDKDFVVKLKSVLSNSFTVGESEILPDDSSVPVVVIIGTKK